MSKKRRNISLIVFGVIFAVLLLGVFLARPVQSHESIKEVMRDAVLHESAKINFFGMAVNPGLVAAYTVTAILIAFALVVRIFVIPRFKKMPGTFQMLLEKAVGLFDGMAKSNSPHRNGILGAYIFTAGAYIFIGTLFELFGVQAVTTSGGSISLPAPLSDINGAIGMGVFSFAFILIGGLTSNGLRGVGQTMKDFSLPISMSFRLFGALLSGALVTELVYHYFNLSFGLPVIVGVLFTLIHALIQAYVLTMLTSVFYGEVTEPHKKKKHDASNSSKGSEVQTI